MGKTVEAKLLLTGEERVSREIAKVTKALRETEKAAKGAKEVERFAKSLESVQRQESSMRMHDSFGRAADQAARAAKEVENIGKATAAVSRGFDLSDRLKRDLQLMGLATREVKALAREAAKMQAEQRAAVAHIGNDKIRAQVLAAEKAALEERIRARAEALTEQRALEEKFARDVGIISRQDAAEKVRAAREATRAAREAERQATREATEAARERARIARQEAQEKTAAARTAVRAQREAAQSERRLRREGSGRLRDAAAIAGIGGGTYEIHRGLRRGAQVAGGREIETARASAVGMSAEDQVIGQKRAYELSRSFPSLDPTELREHYRALHVNLGGNAEAARDTLDVSFQEVVHPV